MKVNYWTFLRKFDILWPKKTEGEQIKDDSIRE